jgi:hypothetical protein
MKKLTLASLVAAATMATSAQAVVLSAADGWEFSVDGEVNQFYVYTEDNIANTETSEVRDGLLPVFLGFNIKGPEVNGLTVGARVSFSPSTNGTSQAAGRQEQREAFATVDGSFGQILFGKALGLYGSHNILTEQTLYGVGWGTGGNGTTTLGGIGMGYDYADWRSQIKWTSPDMSGFKVAFAVVDPADGALLLAPGATGPVSGLTGKPDDETPRFESDLSYAGAFDGGSFKLWASGAYQEHDTAVLRRDAEYWTVGGTLSVAGFEFMAQYSDAEDSLTGGGAAEWDQYVIQAGYRFAGTTLVSANYSELDTQVFRGADMDAERFTVGVYHDVTANLKLVAEYTNIEADTNGTKTFDQDIFSVGGFVTW